MIDPSVVRGLGYYTGPVYEAELTFEILDEKGRKRQFGSVAGGGRYDDLVKRFTGQSVPATGVSIGVDRLLAALRAKGRSAADTTGPVVVTVMDRDRMADYMGMVADLRTAGIRAEVYLGNPKNFGNQLKYADKRNSPIAIIQGGNEAASDTVILKDLILGAQIAQNATLEEWKDRPAQVEVPRADLVAAVRKMLANDPQLCRHQTAKDRPTRHPALPSPSWGGRGWGPPHGTATATLTSSAPPGVLRFPPPRGEGGGGSTPRRRHRHANIQRTTRRPALPSPSWGGRGWGATPRHGQQQIKIKPDKGVILMPTICKITNFTTLSPHGTPSPGTQK